MLFSHSLESIGNTPLVRLTGVEKAFELNTELYAKLESYNPAGSVKDRAALWMVRAAEQSGLLTEGGTVVEATSGNTGIGLAYVCAVKGYTFVAVMPETASAERVKLMKAYGAEVVLTSGKDGMAGSIAVAKRIASERNAYYPDQFSNPANALAHYQSTGVEIYRDLPSADILVAGIGSGGTISGVAKYLKEQNPALLAVGVEPLNSPFLTKGEKGAHKIEGIGAGFQPETLDRTLVDEVLCVDDGEAFRYAKAAAKLDGCFVGISSGAALCGAVALAKREGNQGKKIVVIFPDGGGRYLSNPLFTE